MPLKLSEEDKANFDIYIFEVTGENLVKIPFQNWVDEYYDGMRFEKKAEPYREYQRYLELKEKWEGKDAPSHPGPEPV